MKELFADGTSFFGNTPIVASPWDFELFLSRADWNANAVAANATSGLVNSGVLPKVNLLANLFNSDTANEHIEGSSLDCGGEIFCVALAGQQEH